ncbi:EamA family transporter [Lachnoclostridium sp. An169]|uniref:DMT family transporter n=1 Tax=Lachnoclostridium sp. An169 TaxID=1965569 RepID=UPI000B394C5C|nr:DMT family transporter [Lachnoclostridium sp. An169]OUP84588.1 EamA family transporter [Lachnoclostridium sp. An169]HJA67440.1 DMT family transporter [Candidatus Mediterraneibacter cottocaccae]
MRYRTLNNLLLVLTAFIWGCAFVAQSVGMDYVGPFTFNAARSILGGIALLPVIYVMNRGKKKRDVLPDENKVKHAAEKKQERKTLLLGGICCGAALAVASSLQQIGIMYTSAGKAGFITALYILIVPIIGIFLGKRAGKKVWIGVALAVVGMYFLCINGGFSIARGDFYVILCAVGFSVHILVIDHFSPKVDGVSMSCIQFFVSGILCGIPALIFEQPQIGGMLSAWMPILYAGVLSSGVGYTLQIVAQKKTDPTVASLLMSLESVFSVLAGWVILGERLSGREMFGCVLVFAAVILAQLPEKKKV